MSVNIQIYFFIVWIIFNLYTYFSSFTYFISCINIRSIYFVSFISDLFKQHYKADKLNLLYGSMNMFFLPSKILILVTVYPSLPWLLRNLELSFENNCYSITNSSLYSFLIPSLFISPFLCLWYIVLTSYLLFIYKIFLNKICIYTK